MTRRTSMRGLAAVLLAAAFVLMGGSAAFAQYTIPSTPGTGGGMTFTLTDSTVVAGQSIGVSGTGCAADQNVTFTIGDTTVGSTTADSSGNYSGTVTVPSLSNGTYTINASCGTDVLGLTLTVGTGSGIAGESTGSALARTGSNLGPLAGLGAAAIVLGGAAVYGTKRRRRTI